MRCLWTHLPFALALQAQMVSVPAPSEAGPLHSISVSAPSGRVVAASANRGFEIRGGVAVEIFRAPDGVTLTAAAVSQGAAEPFAVFAGTVTTAASDRDVWIARVPFDGIVTSTRFGGAADDAPSRVVTDAAGAIYIAGNTSSLDFPVTTGRARGGRDGFLVKLNAGLATVYSIYVGGASADDLRDLAVDASGSVYVAAASTSAEIAAGAIGTPAFFRAATTGSLFEPAGGGAFRATVQAWHIPDPNLIFAATAGQGVFRSSDSGQSWEPLNQALGDLNITALAGDAQTLYAGTPRALFRSTNGGASWSETSVAASGAGVRALAVHPRDRNIAYVSTRTACGLFRTADGGRTWQPQTASDPLCAAAILVTPASAYAFASTGVYQQADASQWRRISTFAGATQVAVDGDSWYAVVESKGVWRSTDAGVTWSPFFEGAATSVVAASGKLYIGTTDQGILDASLNRIDDAAILQPVRSLGLAGDGATLLAGADYLPDIYVAKISPRGDQVIFSTFTGGSGVESNPRIALDPSNHLLIAATTTSFDIPATFEAAQKQNAGGPSDLILFRLSPSFDLLSRSYLGGSGSDTAAGLAVDSRGFAYVAAATSSIDLPVTAGAARTTAASPASFLAMLSPGFASVAYASYVGAEEEAARAASIALEGSEAAWIAGAAAPGDQGMAWRLSGLVSYRSISSIRNAASLAAGGPVAPSSTVRIDGTDFGPSILGLSVRFGSSDASLLRLDGSSLEVAAPADLEPGAVVPVVVTSRTGQFQGSVAIDRVAPGLFSANRDGKGVALAAVMRTDADNITTITPVYECVDGPGTCTAVPIEAGDEADQLFLLLRGTGIRNRRSVEDVQVTIGGKSAEVQSANALDSLTGADQIIVKMPAGLASGAAGSISELTIQVTVEGKSANPVTMSWIN